MAPGKSTTGNTGEGKNHMTLSPFHDPNSPIVLCIDDDPDHLLFLRDALWDTGYTFVGAACGEDSLRIVERCRPSLILLDIDMPGLGGIETCRRLRQNPAFESIPIAFLTTRETRANVAEGLTLGANDFILKPLNGEATLQRLGYWTGHGADQPVSALAA
jgi:CheY-like chemotaxis protein